MLDRATAALAELDRELARLVPRFAVASHVVAHGTRPEGIDDKPSSGGSPPIGRTGAHHLEDGDEPRTQSRWIPLRKEQVRKPTR